MITKWTKDREDILRQLWDKGLTCRVIANTIGVSRNAVIGKAHRMKLTKRESPIKRREKKADNLSGCEWIFQDKPPFRNAKHCGKEVIGKTRWCAEHKAKVYRSKPPLNKHQWGG